METNETENLDGLSLTVVIPAFNEEGGIRETIEEVQATLAQMDVPTELIVVDDGSEDNTKEEALKAGARV